MRQVHRAGEKLFIDYCGPTMAVVNPDTGECRQAQIFVAVLGASSYTFACASWSQKQEDWLSAHVKALEYFGGVPALSRGNPLVQMAPARRQAHRMGKPCCQLLIGKQPGFFLCVSRTCDRIE